MSNRKTKPNRPPEPEDLKLPDVPEELDQAAQLAYEEGSASDEALARTAELDMPEEAWREAARMARERAYQQAHQEAAERRRKAEEADEEAEETRWSDVDKAAAAIQPHTSRPRRGNRTTRMLAITAAMLAVLFCALVATAQVLYNKYDPTKFIGKVTAALAAGDAAALQPLLVGVDLEVDEAGAAALCRAFAGEEERAKLQAQLEDQVVDPSATGGSYPALGVEKDSAFLGYASYRMTVHSVQLLLTADAQNLLLSMDGTPRTGDATDGGILYKNLFPGQHTVSVTGVSSTGAALAGGEVPLTLFDTAAPIAFDGSLPAADITVSGCVSDEAVIAVDGVEVPQKPVEGTVSLPQIAVGSTVTMTYTAPHGAVTTGSAVFADKAQTALTFENIQTTGGVPTGSDVNTMLGAYFASYLDAVNNQDIARVTGVTEDLRTALAGGLATERNTSHVFQYLGAACSEASLQSIQIGEEPGFLCVAAYSYHVTEKEGDRSEADEAAYQCCEFVFRDGAWILNRVSDITQEAFQANDVSSLSPAPAATE